LALVAHLLGGLDYEDSLLAFERTVGSSPYDELSDLIDHVLSTTGPEPDEIGMWRRVEEGTAAGIVGVASPGGEDLCGERASDRGLARATRPAEEIRMGRPRRKGGAESHPRPRLMLGAALN
jgi:hypothetical protein